MQIFHDIRDASLTCPTVLTIGNFDGLHRGHQSILTEMKERARTRFANAAATALVTFSPHPLTVLRPEIPVRMLTTPAERLAIAAAQGIEIGVIHPFDSSTAQMGARAFVTLLKTHLALAALIVGPDFALGRGREGDLDMLRELGADYDFTVEPVETISWQRHPVRSSMIRQQLCDGNVREAAELLGRYYAVSGTVSAGDRRGRTIGIPTANLQPPTDRLLPLNGVYVTRTTVGRGDNAVRYGSVTNLGTRPTVNGSDQRLETHLFDFPAHGERAELYDVEISVEFLDRIRDEQRFDSIDALVAQIHADIATAQQILSHQNLLL